MAKTVKDVRLMLQKLLMRPMTLAGAKVLREAAQITEDYFKNRPAKTNVYELIYGKKDLGVSEDETPEKKTKKGGK